jgi:hypothetical protein
MEAIDEKEKKKSAWFQTLNKIPKVMLQQWEHKINE